MLLRGTSLCVEMRKLRLLFPESAIAVFSSLHTNQCLYYHVHQNDNDHYCHVHHQHHGAHSIKIIMMINMVYECKLYSMSVNCTVLVNTVQFKFTALYSTSVLHCTLPVFYTVQSQCTLNSISSHYTVLVYNFSISVNCTVLTKQIQLDSILQEICN